MRPFGSIALALVLASAPRFAHAQTRALDPASINAPTPRCTLHPRPLEPQTREAAPDPALAPAAVYTEGRMLVAWRSVDGVLRLARLSNAFERVGDDRELAGPGGAFAMVSAAGGAALVAVEHSARGGDAVLFARLSDAGEARNVPREVGHADAVDGVAVVWTGMGYAVAWGARGANAGTFIVLTDARGVPTGDAQRVLDATGPRLAFLQASQLVVVAATAGGGEPGVAAMDVDGVIASSSRWPANVRGLVAGPGGAGVLAFGAHGDRDEAALPWVSRWVPGGIPIETDVSLRLAPGATVVATQPDRSGMLAVIDEPGGREWAARVGGDGSATLLAVRPGSLGALAINADGGLILVGHEPPPTGRGRLALVQLVCPRFTPPASVSPAVVPNSAGAAVSPASPSVAGAGNPGADAGIEREGQ